MSYYSTGTISVTNGSTAVTGTGTAWSGAVFAGDTLIGPDGLTYVIASVESDTALTLTRSYAGTTASDAAYEIVYTQARNVSATSATTELYSRVDTMLEGAGKGKLPNGDASQPGVRSGEFQNVGIYFGDQVLGLTDGVRDTSLEDLTSGAKQDGRTFDTIADAVADTKLKDGQWIGIAGSAYKTVPASTYTANGDTVIDLTGSGLQAVLAPGGDFESIAQMQAHPMLLDGTSAFAGTKLFHFVPSGSYTANGYTVVNCLAAGVQAILDASETLEDADAVKGDERPASWFDLDSNEAVISTRLGELYAPVSTGADLTTKGGVKLRQLTAPVVMLAVGQSNMHSTTAQTGGDQWENPNVLIWNNGNPGNNGTAWLPAKFGQPPLNVGSAGSWANNLAYQAANEYQKRTGRRVYLILTALGAHHIEAFLSDTDLATYGWSQYENEADMYDHMTTQLDAALPLVPGAPSRVDHVLFHQGEANKTEQVEVYANKLRVFLKRLELRGNLAKDWTNVVAGEIADGDGHGRFKDRHASALRRLQMGDGADSFPRFKIAPSYGLPLADNVHFSGAALVAFGRRYADALMGDQMPEVLDPTRCDLTVDGGLGWACGFFAATGRQSYWHRVPFNLNDTPFVIENNADLGWCYLAGANENLFVDGRLMFPVSVESQFLIEIDVLNESTTESAAYRLGVREYDKGKAHISANTAANQTLAANTREQFSLRVGAASGSRVNGLDFTSNAEFFSPIIQFNPSGTGAAVRFNIRGMRFI